MKEQPKRSKYTERRKWNGLYNSKEWKRIRTAFLARHPLCQRCLTEGRLTAASVVHHIQAHKGDLDLFFDGDNLAASCKACHDGVEQSIERRGYDRSVGEDGWPTGTEHPVNRD
jgi:5-methylcytosine-specific restriction enzyme A